MLRYRPKPDQEDWEDNPLSNFLAWGSDTFGFSELAKDSNSLLTRFALYVWSDCGVCLFSRGLVLGAISGAAVMLAIVSIL